MDTSNAVNSDLGGAEVAAENNPGAAEVSTNNKPLAADVFSGTELRNLKAAGLTEDQIAALADKRQSRGPKEVGEKADLPQLIEAHAGQLLAEAGGKTLASARTVGLGLKRLGVYHRGYYNACGDSLGRRGHFLPYVAYAGRKQYDLGFIGKSREEKASRQKELRELGPDVIARLVVIADEPATNQEARPE